MLLVMSLRQVETRDRHFEGGKAGAADGSLGVTHIEWDVLREGGVSGDENENQNCRPGMFRRRGPVW